MKKKESHTIRIFGRCRPRRRKLKKLINMTTDKELAKDLTGHYANHEIDISVTKNILKGMHIVRADERATLIKFFHHIHFLSDDEKKEICVQEPLCSWSCVFTEIINNSKLGRDLIDKIDWKKVEDD